jgi:glycosidase
MFGSIMKDPGFTGNRFRPHLSDGQPRFWDRRSTENTPENMELARSLRSVCDERSDTDRVLLGEVFGPPRKLRSFLGGNEGLDGDGLHLVFLFEFLTHRYSAEWFRRTIARFEEIFPDPMLPTYVVENHDRSRSLDRVGGDVDKARVLATILLTVRGVPTIYMGQEIGMRNSYIPLRRAMDPVAGKYFRWVPELVSKRLPERLNRDEVRTPMQWDPSANAGFCEDGAHPWLPVNPEHSAANVSAQSGDPGSLLELYRSLFRVRRARPALHSGSLSLLMEVPEHVLGYDRIAPGRTGGEGSVRVLANLGSSCATMPVPDGSSLLLATSTGVRLGSSKVSLPPDTAVIVEI